MKTLNISIVNKRLSQIYQTNNSKLKGCCRVNFNAGV